MIGWYKTKKTYASQQPFRINRYGQTCQARNGHVLTLRQQVSSFRLKTARFKTSR